MVNENVVRLLALAAIAAGANSCRQVGAERPATTRPIVDARPSGRVTHVVIVWLKRPGDPADRAALIDASRHLKSIPGVMDVQAGPMLPSSRPVVDSTYDVGLVITLADQEALRAYGNHPTHVKLLNEVLKPITDHYRVYDFTPPR